MKSWLLFILSALLIPRPTWAQLTELPAGTHPPVIGQNTAVLTGRVASEAGNAPDGSAEVILECGGEIRAHGYSAQKGNFSLTINLDTSSGAILAPQHVAAIATGEWGTCELYGILAGYRSEHLRLSETPKSGMQDAGTIMLHPISPDHSFAVSVTSLAAPEKAKQALEKGEQQARKGKWSAACDYFKKALAVYPRYALAWLELGRAQVRQNSFADAQQSFRQAVTQDSRLVAGYDELARLALQQHQWKDLADVTGRIVQFAPDATPQYWFFNSAANYNLGNIDKAQASVERGLRMDPNHKIPQMEYLYGLILAGKQNYESASEHVATYLKLAPRANDAEAAKNALTEFQQKAALASK
jgi:outer membrane protein assembly factor BamD (BamD/ComL family)